MAVHEIESLDDPRLEPYRQLKDTNRTRGFGRFVAEGEKLTLRLLASACEVESVLVDRTHLVRLSPYLSPNLQVLVVADRLVPQIVGFNFHRGVLACGKRPASAALDQLAHPLDKPLRIVVLPDVQDPENLGMIIRTSAAFGIDAIVLGQACADPYSRRVLRTSMGAVFRLPLVQSNDLASDPRWLRDEFAVTTIATVLLPDAAPLSGFQPPPRWAILFGNEGHGLDDNTAQLCDHRLTLPMREGTDSLNVSIAAGVFLYQLSLPPHPVSST
jgi:tRNA G18 (ribose-2'-O)-methylase SpoU